MKSDSVFFRFIIVCFLLSSCITPLDLEYIQSNQELSSSDILNYDYRLQPGDLLSVQISTTTEQQHDFFNKENTSNSQLMIENPYLYGYLINDDGNLDLPSFGLIKAEGFTLNELENVIKQIAISYFEKPVVKLNIVNFEVSVLGEVNNPGTFKIVHPEANLLYAVSLAGDITQFGNRRNVKILRDENGTNKVLYVDLTSLDILNSKDFFLHPKDIIYIEPLAKKFYAFNNATGLVSMAISAFTLYLLINNR
tara:strand:- start:69 stop:824 length:756 start_codon:yes stop_codon:yes gene_type:complete